MKTIVLAVVAALALGALAAALLTGAQRTAYQAYATSGARVSEPGHNLVGPTWSGEN
ncbi:MAG: hypothetical protein JWR08_2334 [Enterovirga sp.]|jgi:hypothetical protein|nr:hypothetical protein [Enterovirga sp.]